MPFAMRHKPLPAATSHDNPRLKFLDGLRGLAVALMIINHSARWLLFSNTEWRQPLTYFTVTLSAPIFLFLVGFCLSLSFAAVKDKLGWRQTAFKYCRRGIFIIILGYIFNFFVFANESILSGKVLHCIGASIILAVPFLFWNEKKSGRRATLALSLFLLFGFGFFFRYFSGLSQNSELVKDLFFSDFPLIPWFGFVLLGLVEGGAFGRARNKKGFLAFGGLVGLMLIGIFIVYQIIFVSGPVFAFDYDYNLNNHWIPSIPTLFWIIGMVLLLLRLAYNLWENGKIRANWLIILGQSALMLYFLHHLLALNLLAGFWRIKFEPLPYIVFNVLFVAVLAAAGKWWLAGKKRFKKYFQKNANTGGN